MSFRRIRVWLLVVAMCLACAGTAFAGLRGFSRARRPIFHCNSAPQAACPPIKMFIGVETHLLKGSYFMVFTQDAAGTPYILGDVNTIQEAMDIVQRYWASGDNAIYFQRVEIPPKKKK